MITGEIFIDGVWRKGRGEAFSSIDPAYGHVVCGANSAAAEDVQEAVSAARVAFAAWRLLPLANRLEVIARYKENLAAAQPELAALISRETGKVAWDAAGEVQAMLGKIDISFKAYRERTGEASFEQNGITSELRHKPHGVLAVFGPYNFPGHLPNGHIVPALIAGNTLVWKPSDYTPGVAEFVTRLWDASGLPKGVLNLVQGAKETGVALAGAEDIDGILFTGSVEVGQALHRQYAGKVDKILALEMGGNNPLIVWEEDSQAAVLLALSSAFASTGQRCTCARRLIVSSDKKGDAFLASFIAAAGRLAIGVYDAVPAPFMGPLISNREAEKLLAAEKHLGELGGRPLLPMTRADAQKPFVTPGIIDMTGVENVPDREYFGPMVQVWRVKNFDEAMRKANDTHYGLAAGLINGDDALYARFARDIRAGVIAWNRPTTGASSALPFGGIGVSGNHRPSAYYAADYCAWPVASQASTSLALPANLPPGVTL